MSYRTVVVRTEQSQKTTLLIYMLIYVPAGVQRQREPSCQKEPVELEQVADQDQGFLGTSNWWEARGSNQNSLEGLFISHLAF